ncbi:tetratricopeptide repeat protein, partial [Helicobacter pylori]|uniref:tetratricopeptide repeat protein n=1 Tax=Helicobacter pylori TaxID=210 RepID=UPI00398EDA60
MSNGMGCSLLGALYGSGKGVEKNLTKAAYFYSKACDLNNSGGCGSLGLLYEYGQGVEKDLTKAAYFYSKA